MSSNMEVNHSFGGTPVWTCFLDAANPLASPVQLDASGSVSSVPSGFEDSTPLTLQGVVSLAPGGKIFVQCQEISGEENDDVSALQILATRVSGFQVK